eukprot:PhF_6_TR22314/c0_g1_i3/m.31585
MSVVCHVTSCRRCELLLQSFRVLCDVPNTKHLGAGTSYTPNSCYLDTDFPPVLTTKITATCTSDDYCKCIVAVQLPGPQFWRDPFLDYVGLGMIMILAVVIVVMSLCRRPSGLEPKDALKKWEEQMRRKRE